MSKIITVLLLVLFTFTCLSGQDRLGLILQAEDQLITGDTAKAVTTYKSILEQFPRSFSATKRLAEVYYYQEDYHNGILYSNIAIEIAEDYLFDEQGVAERTKSQYQLDLADAHHLKGLIRMKQFRFKDALEQLNVAVSFDTANHSIQLDRAMLYFTANELDSARYFFHQLKGEPEIRSKVLFSMGNAFYKEKQLDSALFYYRQVTKYYPLFKTAHQYKGLVLTAIQKYRGAIASFSTYLELDTLSEEVYFRRAVLYNELGEVNSALDDWTKVIALNNENQEAFRNRGLTYFQEGIYEKAIKDFDRALELAPDQAYTEINRGYSYYLLGEPNKALKDLNNGISKMPRYYFGYYFRALVKIQLKNKKEGCRDARRAAELGMQESTMDDLVLKKCF